MDLSDIVCAKAKYHWKKEKKAFVVFINNEEVAVTEHEIIAKMLQAAPEMISVLLAIDSSPHQVEDAVKAIVDRILKQLG